MLEEGTPLRKKEKLVLNKIFYSRDKCKYFDPLMPIVCFKKFNKKMKQISQGKDVDINCYGVCGDFESKQERDKSNQ